MCKENYNADASLARARRNMANPAKSRGVINLTQHSEVSEKVIEKYLTQETRRRGMLCLKYNNPHVSGFPDRLIVLPGGKVYWVELKSRGRRQTKLQQIRHLELSRLGHVVLVIDNKTDVDKLLNELL